MLDKNGVYSMVAHSLASSPGSIAISGNYAGVVAISGNYAGVVESRPRFSPPPLNLKSLL